MGEPAISQKALEEAMLKALPTLFPNLLGKASNPHVEFYEKFERAADDHDRDFIKKYEEDLNTTLIFAGLFSAVTSAFIIDVQSKLEPDFEEMNHALLKIIADSALGNIPTGADAALPVWNGPDSTVVRVQAILYSSLSASLLAAFVAMLGKQWLNRYASMEHGSIIDRGRQRKRKMDGMVTWKFALVMECLPLMLQAALLLLGYALSDYLFFINKVVASVLIGFTSFGLLFYFLIVSAATFSYNCPFQTPLPLIFRSLIRFDDEHKRYLKRFREWFGRPFPQMKRWLGRKSRGLKRNASGECIAFPMTTPPHQWPLHFNKGTNWDDYVLDSNCIAWMFEMPMDTDVTMVVARVIPEIVWHPDTRASLLERLYDAVLECFDRSSGYPILRPAFRDKAYLCAKALLHMGIQRKCIGNESENAVFGSISRRRQMIGLPQCGDPDLESTLRVIDRVFGHFAPMRWQGFPLTIPHHAWMSHILLCYAWDVMRKGDPLPDDIREFTLYSLRMDPPPPTPILADCLLIVGLILGINVHPDDLLVVDKSHEVNPHINRIYAGLTTTFRNLTPTTYEVDRALEALELMAHLSENDTASESSRLLHVIMRAPISPAYSQEKKWQAFRLAIRSVYKHTESLPSVGDPLNILTFLDHHLKLALRHRLNQDEPTQDDPFQHDQILIALYALVYASGPLTIDTLKRFNPTEPSFVSSIRYVYWTDKPLELRKVALLFLPLIGDGWLDTPDPIMKPDQMKSFCVDWASAVDAIEHTDDVREAILTVLFGMINSTHWRPHIVLKKWELLGYFTSVPDDFQPLRKCINNPGLIAAINNVRNPAAVWYWLEILWLNYKELIPQVREQLETFTKNSKRLVLDTCLSVMDSESKKAEYTLKQYPTSSTDPAVIILRKKVDNLKEARASLLNLKRGQL